MGEWKQNDLFVVLVDGIPSLVCMITADVKDPKSVDAWVLNGGYPININPETGDGLFPDQGIEFEEYEVFYPLPSDMIDEKDPYKIIMEMRNFL